MSDEFPHSTIYDRYEDLHMGKYTSPDGRTWFEQPRVFGRQTYACENYLAIWDHHRHDGVKITQKDGTVLGYFPTMKAAHESVFGVPKNERSSDAAEITRLRAELVDAKHEAALARSSEPSMAKKLHNAEARVTAADEHLVSALEAIIEGYPRSDISHEDFRVQVTHWAEDALTEYRKTETQA
nr:hypothetical protein [uncultured Celeribacter sp.]